MVLQSAATLTEKQPLYTASCSVTLGCHLISGTIQLDEGSTVEMGETAVKPQGGWAVEAAGKLAAVNVKATGTLTLRIADYVKQDGFDSCANTGNFLDPETYGKVSKKYDDKPLDYFDIPVAAIPIGNPLVTFSLGVQLSLAVDMNSGFTVTLPFTIDSKNEDKIKIEPKIVMNHTVTLRSGIALLGALKIGFSGLPEVGLECTQLRDKPHSCPGI